MKEEICKAFCDGLHVRQIPIGHAVSTPFVGADGDPVGFYIARDDDREFYRLEDNGLVLPMMEANGLDFKTGTRAEAMSELLTEYKVEIDADGREFVIRRIEEKELPSTVLRFIAFQLRVRDFALMTEARIVGTFRDDVAKLLKESLEGRALIREQELILPTLPDFPADFVITAPDRPPVGVFLGTSNARVLEAVVVRMRAIHETHDNCSVIALLERGGVLTTAVRRQATNRLNAITEFRGDERQAIQRIADEALGSQAVH